MAVAVGMAVPVGDATSLGMPRQRRHARRSCGLLDGRLTPMQVRRLQPPVKAVLARRTLTLVQAAPGRTLQIAPVGQAAPEWRTLQIARGPTTRS